jgi:citrate lyase subunit beta / citryl-CoA lyase
VSDVDGLFRARRSVLYMPAANERALEKAKTIAADALIFDLEDAVAPDQKDLARERACAAVLAGGYGEREVVIRVNGFHTPWHDQDMEAAVAAGPAAVLVPKVDTPYQVRTVASALVAHRAPMHTRVWAMLETPSAILDAPAIAAASDMLTVLVMGTNDLVKELRATRTPDRVGLVHALSACVVAARAADKAIIDGVFNDVTDADGFAAECRQGRALGFDGKTLIHPSQVEPCNETFRPDSDEIRLARRTIEAFEAARADGRGVVTLDGRMIENLHVDEARRVLATAAAIAARG